jgi:hypothetical protein
MTKSRIILLSIGIVLLFATAAQAKIDTMTVSELKPGMTGTGRTVVKDTLVEDFNVEIIGILAKGGFNGEAMILIRCSGPVIDSTGGVAGGYSGSPIFINGKLVGALSSAWYFADHSVAGVTPINEMMKNFTYVEKPGGEIKMAKLDKPVTLFDRQIENAIVCMSSEETSKLQNQLGDNTMVLTACKTPLYINGLNPELLDMVKEKLGPMLPYIEIMPGMGNASAGNGYSVSILDGPSQIEPGSAIGMQLVSGDIDMTAIGTATWVDPDDPEKKILMFGHPFLQRGRIEAPITSARIAFTMPALDRSFKMGEALDIIGVSHQDRSCAVSGYLGRLPDLVDVNFTISDLDQNKSKKYKLGVIKDEELMPYLAMLGMMQGMTFCVDRNGQATAKVAYTIKGEGLADPISRTNMYFSESGPSNVMNEPLEILSILTGMNIFREVSVTEIDVNVEFTENRQTLDLVEIAYVDEIKSESKPPETVETNVTKPASEVTQPDQEELLGKMQEVPKESVVKPELPQSIPMPTPPLGQEIRKFNPGDTIEVKVTIKPYRGEPYDEILEIKIPMDINSGITQLEVRGGGGFPNRFMQGQALLSGLPMGLNIMPMISGAQMEKPPKTLDEVIDEFLKRDHNNELIIQLHYPQENNPKPDSENKEKTSPIKEVKSTDKVIYGMFQLPLEIVKSGEEKKDEGASKSKEEKAGKKSNPPNRSDKNWKNSTK